MKRHNKDTIRKQDLKKIDRKHLKKLLKFKNKMLIERFAHVMDISDEKSQSIFEDMLRFLWLCDRAYYHKIIKKKKNIPTVFIFDSNAIIDEMWHMFILDTKGYTDFCIKYFGRYRHHEQPIFEKTPRKKTKIEIEKFDTELANLIEYTCQELGKKVAHRWYIDYAEKFPKKLIKQRQAENYMVS